MRYFPRVQFRSGIPALARQPTGALPRRWGLAACGAALVALIIAATAALTLDMRSRAIRDTERELANVGLILSEQIAQSFHAIEVLQVSLIEHLQSKEIESGADLHNVMGTREVHQMLADKISGLPHVDAVTIIDASGLLINFSRSWPIPALDLSDRDYFKALRPSSGPSTFLSEPVLSRASGTWTIYLAHKFTGSDGTFLGLVLCAIRLEYFQNYFSSIQLGQDGALALLRGDGILLARYPVLDGSIGRSLRVIAKTPTSPSMLRQRSLLDGLDRLFAIQPIRDFPAIISASMTVSAAVAQTQRDAIFLSAAGAALAFCVGTVVYLLVQRRAIEQQQAQGALERQQRTLDAALNNMSRGLVMFDAEGRVVLCNERYLQMYRIKRQDVPPGCDRVTLLEARRAVGTFSGDAQEYCVTIGAPPNESETETLMEMPDGREINIVRRPMADGGWVATHEDVTERRRAERERDRNRDFLDRVIENVPVAIIVKDARDLRYVLLNRASEARLGCAEGDAIGKCAHDFFSAERAEQLETMERGILREKRPRIIPEHEFNSPAAGTRVQKTTHIPILGDDGEPVYMLIVTEDLTEHKAMQLQLQQAVKMEAVGNLTGGIAHDFNNLLMVMIGNLDLIAEEMAEAPSVREKVDTVLKASLHGAELTRQMLAFARRQPLNPKRVAVNDSIDAMVRMLGRTLGTDIAIELKASDGLWPARVDESQLQSSLVNIAVNARDAMPAGGTLIVEASNVTIEADAANDRERMTPGDYVMIAMSDTGTGMPPELVARVFEPFVTTKPHGKGSGLGLSMVYGFVKQSGGHVGIYSEVGRGTTIRLYLPRDLAESERRLPPTSESLPLGGGETVLAVDDNKDVLKTVERQLTDLGYTVVTAGSALSALSTLERGVPADLLFTDVVMPGGMSGKELADEALRTYPHLRILLTSGFTDKFLANDSSLHNRYSLLSKPYRKHDLACAVRHALDGGDRAKQG